MKSQYVTSYWSLIVTLAVSAIVFEIFTLKDRKLLILPTPHLFDAALGGTPYNFWMKLTLQELEGWGYRMVKIS